MNGLNRIGKAYPLAVWLALAAGLVVRLAIAWQPVQELVMRFNADDAYYYLTIARNVVSGQGVSFDGIAPTNGFHPLYLTLLIVLFWITSSAVELNVHLALSLLSVCNVLTALPLYTTVKRMLNDEAALVAAVAWLFNPWVVAITLLGVESAVYVCVMAWTVCVYVDWRMGKREALHLVAVGVLAGLTVLARTDGIFLVIAIALELLYGARWKKGFNFTAIFCSSVGLTLFPWLVWNWFTFGTFAQTSGMAILYSQSYALPTAASSVFSSVGMFLLTITFMMFQGAILVLGVLITGIVLQRDRATCFNAVRDWLSKGKFLLIYGASWLVFYAAYFQHRQLWYFLPIVFIATVGVGGLYVCLKALLPRSPQILRLGILAFYGISFVLSLWFWSINQLAFYPAQANGYTIARWISENTEPQARIGVWNAGIVGYFSTRTIVNLDGVVNNELYRYISDRQATFRIQDLRDYLVSKQVRYLTDYEALCDDATLQGVDWLEPISECPSLYGKCIVRVYRIVNQR